MRIGILTLSDRSARGERPDASGPVIAEFARAQLQAQVEVQAVIPDEYSLIRDTLLTWCDQRGLDVIFTTGGTGFAARDVTPEATRAVIEREAPGLAEAMRAASLQVTRHAMLSRAVCGIRRRTLIINLPGSPKGVRENLETIAAVLPHAVELLREAPDAEQGHRTV
ncbi:MAG: MogA/MoaB family molybdenum cofactor biosynthesis protein [Anaerolineales bacterium]|nr:MogA/MoaB family molybdenum cofactor biosynthesis protein [Anaerolineales bacterium]